MINFSLVSSVLLLINYYYYYFYTKITIFYYFYYSYYCKNSNHYYYITYYPMSGMCILSFNSVVLWCIFNVWHMLYVTVWLLIFLIKRGHYSMHSTILKDYCDGLAQKQHRLFSLHNNSCITNTSILWWCGSGESNRIT